MASSLIRDNAHTTGVIVSSSKQSRRESHSVRTACSPGTGTGKNTVDTTTLIIKLSRDYFKDKVIRIGSIN
jgi:hypothetical protein